MDIENMNHSAKINIFFYQAYTELFWKYEEYNSFHRNFKGSEIERIYYYYYEFKYKIYS